MSGTKVKLCGMSRMADIEAVNELKPDYIGFVFFERSSRNVSPELAAALKAALDPQILAAGVFVDAAPEFVADLMNRGVIDIAQLHGHEDDTYIAALRMLTKGTIVQAFKVRTAENSARAEHSAADCILLDSGAGSGECFDWSLVKDVKRPFFLAGGLTPDNVQAAIAQIHPYAVDVSSGIETDRVKDRDKMRAFVENVRSAGA